MLTVLTGDAIEQLRTLSSESVQCCVTSPPYWGLRDYGTAAWEGGDSDCHHQISSFRASDKSTLNGGKGVGPNEKIKNDGVPYRSECGKCGARRIDSQLGLEKTPEEYVAKMVEVFREVRRVLRKDGTLWLNLGDSYAQQRGGRSEGSHDGGVGRGDAPNNGSVSPPPGFKPKDLCGIPWRVAFALQADGWWLRSDIIWSKPNPMPESVTDRPTKAHEYFFLLTKSANYFYDYRAILEPAAYDGRMDTTVKPSDKYAGRNLVQGQQPQTLGRGLHQERWPNSMPDSYKGSLPGRKDGPGHERRSKNDRIAYNQKGDNYGPNGQAFNQMHAVDGVPARNKRTVWTVTTQPYPEAHFATYPPDLIKPCIMAGTSAKGCCSACGAPWKRIVERTPMVIDRSDRTHELGHTRSSGTMLEPNHSETLGWKSTCKCNANIQPCTVLDPFAGSGTTGAVALELGRKAVLIELNPKYCHLIEQRCNVTPGLQLA